MRSGRHPYSPASEGRWKAFVEVQTLSDASVVRSASSRQRGSHGGHAGGGGGGVGRARWCGSHRPRSEWRRAGPDVLLSYCEVPNVGERTDLAARRRAYLRLEPARHLPFTLDKTFVRRALRTTPVVVSNSEHGAEYLETFGASREHVRGIPNGADLEESVVAILDGLAAAPGRPAAATWRA